MPQIEVLNVELASRDGRIAELEEQLEASRRTIAEKEQSVLKMRIETSRSSQSVNATMLEVCPFWTHLNRIVHVCSSCS